MVYTVNQLGRQTCCRSCRLRRGSATSDLEFSLGWDENCDFRKKGYFD